jgi:hypothetical protein
MEYKKRECGECNLCCKWLTHEVYGQVITPNNPCRFVRECCTIYEDRPETCKNYQCLWLQGVLPEWMYPHLIGVIVSVKDWTHGQYLEVCEAGKPLTIEVLSLLFNLNVPIKYQLHGSWILVGSLEFKQFIAEYEKSLR